MTIRLLSQYGKYPANAIVTLDAATEAGLIAHRDASATLTGGVAYSTPAVPQSPTPAYVDPAAQAATLTVSGLLGVGQLLTASFSGKNTGTVQFQRDSGAGPVDIPGAISLTYLQVAADRGCYINARSTSIGLVSQSVYVPSASVGGTALAITGSPPTVATVGVPYSVTFAASGGSGTYSFALASGSLSGTGLALSTTSSTATISGTPTTAGNIASLSVQVTDGVATPVVSAPWSIAVSAAQAALIISGTPPPTATVGVPYTFTPTTAGGAGGNVFSLTGTLPPGLSRNASTGQISGTPTTAATFAGLVETVTDAALSSASLPAFTITVAAAVSVPDTAPGWFAAPSTAATTGTAAFIAGRTDLANSTNGGKSGTGTLTTTGSNYAWFAVANSATPTFTDVASTFTGGFTLIGTFVDANNTTWYLYRSDYPGSYTNKQVTLS